MTSRNPLVQVSGSLAEMPATDTLQLGIATCTAPPAGDSTTRAVSSAWVNTAISNQVTANTSLATTSIPPIVAGLIFG